MTGHVLMCKSHSSMRECSGYFHQQCRNCIKRDVVLVHVCDVCGDLLDEEEQPQAQDGQELCRSCRMNTD